jgi:hypothetical protein
MVEYYKTTRGYFYKKKKNGEVTRVSSEVYKRNVMKGGLVSEGPNNKYNENKSITTANTLNGIHIQLTQSNIDYVKQKMGEGWNDLHKWCYLGNYKKVREILENPSQYSNIDINKRDNKGRTPLYMAVVCFQLCLISITEQDKRFYLYYQIILDLLKNDNIRNIPDMEGITPIQILKFMIKEELKQNVTNVRNVIPITLKEVIELLNQHITLLQKQNQNNEYYILCRNLMYVYAARFEIDVNY